jgi:HSP20 family molecular chaperone IbpA
MTEPTAESTSSGQDNLSVASPQRWVRRPPIDIFEADDSLVLRADLPGVSVDRLELQIQENKLTLFGRPSPVADDPGRLIHQEYPAADFLRSFILTDEFDHERISAKINDGVLEVTLPRTTRREPRRIEVRTEQTQ